MAAMKTKTLALGLLVLAFAAATALGCSRDSPCGGDQCCSQYGYCGTGGDYCGPGCQSGRCYAGAAKLPAHIAHVEGTASKGFLDLVEPAA